MLLYICVIAIGIRNSQKNNNADICDHLIKQWISMGFQQQKTDLLGNGVIGLQYCVAA
jgi:hypothetical protein